MIPLLFHMLSHDAPIAFTHVYYFFFESPVLGYSVKTHVFYLFLAEQDETKKSKHFYNRFAIRITSRRQESERWLTIRNKSPLTAW